jgi:epidermal growth factor receptor substrate 15
MHTVRSGSLVYDAARLRPQQTPINSENVTRVPAPPSRSPSTSLEQSPAVAEVLRQIASAKTSVAELRAQLSECQTSASQSRSVLQHEVDAHREQKRQEDISKAELKTRTKNLEDSKRTAEGLKKEADKKLKVAHTARDDSTCRMEFLGTGISELHDQLAQDLEFISSLKDQAAEEERLIPSSIERKRQGIKLAEDRVHALNRRSRELEEKLSSRREKLRILREKVEQYKERSSAPNSDQQQQFHPRDLWLIGTDDVRRPLTLSPLPPVQRSERVWNMQIDSFGAQYPSPSTISSISPEEHVTALNGPGFSPFSDSSLFNGYSNDIRHSLRTAQGYFAQELGPGTAFEGDNKMSRSFQPDSDSNSPSVPYLNGKLDGSPLTPSSASTDDVYVSSLSRPDHGNGPHSPPAQRDKPRFRGSSLSSMGLNPDAKEFNFSPNIFKSSGARRTSPTTYDALNPNGIPSTTLTTQQSLLRAFALSPAEREALQRTCGLSNKSCERLPSLSDVGSIPSSPTNGHGISGLVTSSAGDFGSRLPAWLQSLPRNRKANFSPWDDEEPQGVSNPRKS